MKADPGERTDDELVARACHGERSSIELLVQRYEKRVFGFLFRMTGHTSDAEDLTQEVFVRAFRSFPRYQAQGHFKSWLFTIARNVCKTHFGKKSQDNRNLAPEVLPDGIPAPGSKADSSGEGDVRSMVSFLPEEFRRVTLLKYVSDLTCAEIALVEEISEASVKQRLHRARNMIRENLDSVKKGKEL